MLLFQQVHHFGRREVTVAAHHDLDRGPVATDATDDVTQDLLDFLARWPFAGAQQRQHGPAGRRPEDLGRLEAVAAGMGVEQCKLLLSAARPGLRSTARRMNAALFDDSVPPANVAVTVFPAAGDRPGRNSVAFVMVSRASCWPCTILFRQQNHTWAGRFSLRSPPK